jgi:hypothetical protein
MNEIRPLTQRMVLDGMYPGVVEKWADEVAVLEARIEALEKAHNAAEAWGEAISVWGPHDERTTAALVAWDIARAALAAEEDPHA